MCARPLFWCSLTLCAGLLLAPRILFSSGALSAIAASFFAGSLLLGFAATTERGVRTASLFLLAGFLLAGCTAGLVVVTSEPGRLDNLLVSHPRQSRNGNDVSGKIRRISEAGEGSERLFVLDLDINAIVLGRLRHPTTGTARFYIRELPARLPQRGDSIHLFARLKVPRPFSNPGSMNPVRYRRLRNLDATGWVKSSRLVQVIPSDPYAPSWTRVLRLGDRLRGALLDRLERTFADTGSGRRAAAVSAALLVGERGSLSSEERLLLQQAGLTHLLAVSGFNVAVLAGLVVFILRCTRVHRRWGTLLLLPCLGLYLVINNDESSVVRAVTMACLYFLGRTFTRTIDALNTLGLSAIIILALSPVQILSPGFQLTFSATLALLASGRFFPPGQRGGQHPGMAIRATRMLFIATLSAIVATLPLVAFHFNRVTPAALPSNLVAGPATALAFVGVLALEATAPAGVSVGRILADGVTLCVDFVFKTAALVTDVPGTTWRRATPGLVTICFYYMLLLLMLSAPSGCCRRLIMAPWLATLLLVAFPSDTRKAPAGLKVTMFDVGQGESILIESPDGHRALVDAGGTISGSYDIGERVVGRALWNMGISSLDLVIISHGDLDHAAGAAAIIRGFSPEHVWIGPDVTSAPDHPGILNAREGDFLERGTTRLSVLHPRRNRTGERGGNESSLVLRVEAAGRSLLLMGDAGQPTEARLLRQLASVDLLKVGHHGSRSSSASSFVQRLNPLVGLVSCGRDNRFGHPHGEVLDRFRRIGTRICRTDTQGAVSVELLEGGTRLSADCALFKRGRDAE